ncbi:MAG TPA: hypothetical protein VH641_10755 [Streptosporangiaceae bacterium]
MHPVILELLAIDRVYFLIAKAQGWPRPSQVLTRDRDQPAK